MAVCLKKAVHHFSRYGFFIALACCMGLSAMVRGASVQSTSPAYFISIDALQPVLLKAAADGGVLKGRHGFSWLLAGALVYDRALPLVTLTAASHISTITCTPPSRHGIVANAFLKGGAEHNGFTEPFRQEPLWRSAMRQGKKVLTLGYVGADNTAAERHADFTLSFPDETLLGPEQRLSWQVEQLPAAVDWTLPEEMAAASGLRETTLTIVLNPQSGERRTLSVLIEPRPGGASRIHFASAKNLRTGLLGTLDLAATPRRPLDLFFTEKDKSSPQVGFLRRSFVYPLPAAQGTLALYISNASYNNAYPQSFRIQLDQLRLVWPAFGEHAPEELPAAERLEVQAMIDRFLTRVAHETVPALGVDIVLFYQPLLDTVAHQVQAALPHPFLPQGQDVATRSFVRAFEIVDEDLDLLLDGAGENATVMLMGDHGMDAMRFDVNLATLLSDAEQSSITLFNSGTQMMLYAAPNLAGDAKALARVDIIAAALKQRLAALRHDGEQVLAEAPLRNEFAASGADYRKEWQYGEARAALLPASGYMFVFHRQKRDTFLPTKASGKHGTSIKVPTMATTLLIKGSGVRPGHREETSLINAVPTFSKLLGIAPPHDCLGEALTK